MSYHSRRSMNYRNSSKNSSSNRRSGDSNMKSKKMMTVPFEALSHEGSLAVISRSHVSANSRQFDQFSMEISKLPEKLINAMLWAAEKPGQRQVTMYAPKIATSEVNEDLMERLVEAGHMDLQTAIAVWESIEMVVKESAAAAAPVSFKEALALSKKGQKVVKATDPRIGFFTEAGLKAEVISDTQIRVWRSHDVTEAQKAAMLTFDFETFDEESYAVNVTVAELEGAVTHDLS